MLDALGSMAQTGPYAPQVGTEGTDAIAAESALFVDWAATCTVQRGLRQINVPDSGLATVGSPLYAIGAPDAPLTVSLGDSGVAVLTFHGAIYDGPGADFAVFENGFGAGTEVFLELAFVEASSDGEHYFRFPAACALDSSVQVTTFQNTDASYYHNLAGKYLAKYGVPFDLDELPDTVLLDKQRVTHVRIVDVVGCVQAPYASKDADNRIVNDPWPTNFPQSGFDLDAVGVIHSTTPLGVENELQEVTLDHPQEVECVDLSGRSVPCDTPAQVIIHRNGQGVAVKRILW